MEGIRWYRSMEQAEREAFGTGKFLLFFFHHPECRGSRKTRETTFKDKEVIGIVNSDFIPASFDVTEAQNMTARYNVELTPTFVITDEYGRELERWVGYLPPEDFITQIRLSQGLSAFHMERFKDAEGAFQWIIDNRPDSDSAPEARYYMGVSFYKETGDQAHLSRTWEAMSKRYPGHPWTKRASAWST